MTYEITCAFGKSITNVPLEDGDAVAAGDVVGDLGSEAFVVHKEEVDFPHVVHEELLKAVGEEVAGLKRNDWHL